MGRKAQQRMEERRQTSPTGAAYWQKVAENMVKGVGVDPGQAIPRYVWERAYPGQTGAALDEIIADRTWGWATHWYNQDHQDWPPGMNPSIPIH